MRGVTNLKVVIERRPCLSDPEVGVGHAIPVRWVDRSLARQHGSADHFEKPCARTILRSRVSEGGCHVSGPPAPATFASSRRIYYGLFKQHR
jgi:hypothetical protein